MFAAMHRFDAAVALLDERHHGDAWLQALAGIEADDAATPLLRGCALRRLYDGRVYDVDKTAVRLARALSSTELAQKAGNWLEGFLSGAAQVLLHDAQLFGMIDRWLGGISEADFIELLPVVRRAVSSFDSMERRRLLEQVKRGRSSNVDIVVDDPGASAAFEKALPLLKLILGLTDDRAA